MFRSLSKATGNIWRMFSTCVSLLKTMAKLREPSSYTEPLLLAKNFSFHGCVIYNYFLERDLKVMPE